MFNITMPPNVHYLLEILMEAGYEAYAVGGCVRDSILDKEPHDWDLCTNATPEEMCGIFSTYDDIEIYLTGIKHGTITARIDGQNYEITTYRIDGVYSDNRRPDNVTFVDNITEDLSRRDFTINAMAYSDVDGLADPWGGYGDLRIGMIRCVGDPDDRFNEDALRILRALRFASTYGFKIEDITSRSIHRNKGLLNNIAAERIQSELAKMLCGKGVLDILIEYNDVMAVIIPELKPCIGFDQNNKYHAYTVYDHIAHAVSEYHGYDIAVKMALLLHDIGKPECYTEDHNGGHFHGHSVPSARIAEEVMKRLRFDKKTTKEVVDLVRYHDTTIEPQIKTVRRWLNKIGYDLFAKLMCVRLADISAHSDINKEPRRKKYEDVYIIAGKIIAEQQCFSLKDLAVNGFDIMSLGVASGPVVGITLEHLLDKVLAGELKNDTDVLLTEAVNYLLTKG